MFKCPYCTASESKEKSFSSWEQVSNHARFCKNKTKEYHISSRYGPIHYLELLQDNCKDKYPLLNRSQVLADFKKTGLVDKDFRLIKKISREDVIAAINNFVEEFNKIPTSKDFASNRDYPSDSTVKRLFGTWNNAILASGLKITKKGNREGKVSFTREQVIEHITQYYEQHIKIPTSEEFFSSPEGPRDFHVRKYFSNYTNLINLVFTEEQQSYWNKDRIYSAVIEFYSKYSKIQASDCVSTNNLPSIKTITKYYGTFNKMLLELDIPINNVNGCFGVYTNALDGHVYRSKAEAYFVDRFLYNKYDYVIEPKYPEPYYKYYDWYLPSLDLYIELDGGCRPSVIQEKIRINKLLKHKLLVIPINALNNFKNLEELLNIFTKDTV